MPNIFEKFKTGMGGETGGAMLDLLRQMSEAGQQGISIGMQRKERQEEQVLGISQTAFKLRYDKEEPFITENGEERSLTQRELLGSMMGVPPKGIGWRERLTEVTKPTSYKEWTLAGSPGTYEDWLAKPTTTKDTWGKSEQRRIFEARNSLTRTVTKAGKRVYSIRSKDVMGEIITTNVPVNKFESARDWENWAGREQDLPIALSSDPKSRTPEMQRLREDIGKAWITEEKRIYQMDIKKSNLPKYAKRKGRTPISFKQYEDLGGRSKQNKIFKKHYLTIPPEWSGKVKAEPLGRKTKVVAEGDVNVRRQAISELRTAGYPLTEENIQATIQQLK